MLDEAYYYGLTPLEAEQLTAGEMAFFIKSNRRRELDMTKTSASIAYSAGIIASMSLSKKRPRFSEVFNFPESRNEPVNIESYKAHMLVWAERTNKIARKEDKK